MPFPDDLSRLTSLFPLLSEQRAEARDAQSDRMAAAVVRVDLAMEELVLNVGTLAEPPDAEWYDVDDAEKLAATLEALVASRRPGIGGVS